MEPIFVMLATIFQISETVRLSRKSIIFGHPFFFQVWPQRLATSIKQELSSVFSSVPVNCQYSAAKVRCR